MKIIDLLNKIANGEIPQKIKYDNRFYIFNKEKDNYYENDTCSINWDYVSLHCLNEEVEIIEEKKIEKIVQENLVIGSPNGAKVSFSIADSILLDKINEIIEEINGRN